GSSSLRAGLVAPCEAPCSPLMVTVLVVIGTVVLVGLLARCILPGVLSRLRAGLRGAGRTRATRNIGTGRGSRPGGRTVMRWSLVRRTGLRTRTTVRVSVGASVGVPCRRSVRVTGRGLPAPRLPIRVRVLVRTDRRRLTGFFGGRRSLLLWRRRGLLTGWWPRFATFHRQLARGLDRWLIRGKPIAELVEHRDPGPLLHRGKDPFQVLTLQRLLLQHFADQVVQHFPIVVQDMPRFGVCSLDEFTDLLIDLVRDFERVVGILARRPAEEGVALFLAVLDGAESGAHPVFLDH